MVGYRKGTKVYFKVGVHRGYRQGVVRQVIPLSGRKSHKEYYIKPTDAGTKPSTRYYVLASKVRRRKK